MEEAEALMAECQQAPPHSQPRHYNNVAPYAPALPAAVVRAGPVPPRVAEPGQQPGIDWLSETSGIVPAERVRTRQATVRQKGAGTSVGKPCLYSQCMSNLRSLFWGLSGRPALPHSCAAPPAQGC